MVGVFMPTIYFYNGLPVCDYRVRVNRYIIVFLNMLTNIFYYGIIENVKRGSSERG